MDVSPSGFRMAHDCASLRSGQLVEFAHPEAKGRARVMWNRILADGVERQPPAGDRGRLTRPTNQLLAWPRVCWTLGTDK